MNQTESGKSVKKSWMALWAIVACLLLWLAAKTAFSGPLGGVSLNVGIQGEGENALILVNLENTSRRPVDIIVLDLPGSPNSFFHGNVILCVGGRRLVGYDPNYLALVTEGTPGDRMWRLHRGSPLSWSLPISDLRVYDEQDEHISGEARQDFLRVDLWIPQASSPGCFCNSWDTLLTSENITVPQSVVNYLSEAAWDEID